MKKVPRLLLALALALALAPGLAAAPQKLTVWCWDPNFNVAIMKEAAARYTAKHPETTFNIVDFAKADVEQSIELLRRRL